MKKNSMYINYCAGCRVLLLTISISIIFVLGPRQSGAADEAVISAQKSETQGQSLTEVNKQLSNPVSNVWSLSFQQTNYYLHNPHRWHSNLQFQPVLPVALTKNWNLITRPVFQLFNDTPYVKHNGKLSRTTGFGDTILMEMLSPNSTITGNWLLGLGPTFIFPTATTDWTGQGKWQAGPAAVLGYLSKKWIAGIFPQQWWSFAGGSRRQATSQLNLQPFAGYFFGEGWSIGYSGNIVANWKSAKYEDRWTVPIGMGISKVLKVGKLPVKIGIAGQYMPRHPDAFGQQWNILFSITPVIPKLIKGTIFRDS
jgi:hypothetical protein